MVTKKLNKHCKSDNAAYDLSLLQSEISLKKRIPGECLDTSCLSEYAFLFFMPQTLILDMKKQHHVLTFRIE